MVLLHVDAEDMIRISMVCVAAFFVSLALVPISRYLARRFGYIAMPTKDRWHTQATPTMGGVAIAITVFGLALVFGQSETMWVLLASAGLMFCIGFIDDISSLKPSTKLAAELAIAALLVFFGYRLEWVESLPGDTLLTLIWIVGITNAFNLLDNMDGLCAGIALIAGVSLFLAYGGSFVQQPEAVYLALVLGAAAGFLVYNIHPASVFLGDSGSLFLGASLAILSLGLDASNGSQANVLGVVAVPAFVLLIPIFDTTLVTFSRLLSGRDPAVGGRDHSSHRLVAIGLSERAAVVVLWSLAAMGGGVGVVTRYVSPEWSVLLGALFLIAMGLFAVYLSQVGVYDDVNSDTLRGQGLTPLVVNFVYRRRIVEVMLDACLIAVAYYAAYRLRFEGDGWSSNFQLFLQSLPLVVGAQVLALTVAGSYRGVWRHFTLIDGVVFTKSVLLGTASSVLALLFLYRFEDYSRTVFLIYALLLLLLLVGSRCSFRLISELIRRRRRSGNRLLVYGSDDDSVLAYRSMVDQARADYRMLGFIDDDRELHGRRVHGYSVLGGSERMHMLIRSQDVDTVLLGTSIEDQGRVAELKRLCSDYSVSLCRMDIGVRNLLDKQ